MNSIFLKPNDPLLKIVSEKADPNSKETKKIIKTMVGIIKNEQKQHKKGVGLAAPQIGILKRIILIDVAANRKGPGGDLRVYINPEITWSSKRKGEWYEGCYSTGKICGIVSRPTSIKIRAFVLQGDALKAKYTGYVARIFQHEIDHLNGKVFTDHIKNPDHLHWVEEHEFPVYRNKGAWKTWPKKASLLLANQASKKV